MELFEEIRRDREREGLSIRALARRHGVHRRMVRQALASPLPPPRRRPQGRPAPRLGPYRPVIDEWLTADREAPRKQRHTAKRVWERLRDEYGAEVAETTVRDYVCRRRRETQQAFLEAHVEALRFFGGVFQTVRYDNLRSAVKKVLRGRWRVEQDRFVALRSHYLFESAFTRTGREGAHEKGGVEGEVGRFRRAHLVPVPKVGSLKELNGWLEDACFDDLRRRIRGRAETVGEALRVEARALRELPLEDFETAEQATPRVDQKALVTIRHNRYSVPVALAGLRVQAAIGAREIVIRNDGREVARHPRLYARYQTSAKLDHYLELLRRKPGALRGSLPLRQERQRGRWPACFDELWAGIEGRYGASEAARQMVDVLLLVREHGAERVELAVRGTLAAGAFDGRAVALLCRRSERSHPEPLAELPERLRALHERPQPSTAEYDQLRGGGA